MGLGSILVAEDDAEVRSLICLALEHAGFTVRAVSDGATALQELKSHPVDLLISNLRMPRLDGRELLNRIRTDKALSDLPVLVVSGYVDTIPLPHLPNAVIVKT